MCAVKLAEEPMATDVPVTTWPCAFLMMTLRDESAVAVPMMLDPTVREVEQASLLGYPKISAVKSSSKPTINNRRERVPNIEVGRTMI